MDMYKNRHSICLVYIFVQFIYYTHLTWHARRTDLVFKHHVDYKATERVTLVDLKPWTVTMSKLHPRERRAWKGWPSTWRLMCWLLQHFYLLMGVTSIQHWVPCHSYFQHLNSEVSDEEYKVHAKEWAVLRELHFNAEKVKRNNLFSRVYSQGLYKS